MLCGQLFAGSIGVLHRTRSKRAMPTSEHLNARSTGERIDCRSIPSTACRSCGMEIHRRRLAARNQQSQVVRDGDCRQDDWLGAGRGDHRGQPRRAPWPRKGRADHPALPFGRRMRGGACSRTRLASSLAIGSRTSAPSTSIVPSGTCIEVHRSFSMSSKERLL